MTDNVSAEQLRQFIERIERLEEEKRGFADDIKDVYAEAKSTGFDPKTMKHVVRLRKTEKHHRQINGAPCTTQSGTQIIGRFLSINPAWPFE